MVVEVVEIRRGGKGARVRTLAPTNNPAPRQEEAQGKPIRGPVADPSVRHGRRRKRY